MIRIPIYKDSKEPEYIELTGVDEEIHNRLSNFESVQKYIRDKLGIKDDSLVVAPFIISDPKESRPYVPILLRKNDETVKVGILTLVQSTTDETKELRYCLIF